MYIWTSGNLLKSVKTQIDSVGWVIFQVMCQWFIDHSLSSSMKYFLCIAKKVTMVIHWRKRKGWNIQRTEHMCAVGPDSMIRQNIYNAWRWPPGVVPKHRAKRRIVTFEHCQVQPKLCPSKIKEKIINKCFKKLKIKKYHKDKAITQMAE